MVSQENLARSFENGATHGTASSVEITDIAGGHALVDTRGEGAVLAFRYPSGHVVAFEGWYGFSVSTSAMMTKMGLSHVCRHDEDRVYRANTTAADSPTTDELDEWLDEHDPTHIGQAVSSVNK